jgi:hypothetical protein
MKVSGFVWGAAEGRDVAIYAEKASESMVIEHVTAAAACAAVIGGNGRGPGRTRHWWGGALTGGHVITGTASWRAQWHAAHGTARAHFTVEIHPGPKTWHIDL